MTVTIKDIAKQAGVSITTVSRAMNGYRDIHPETRKRVLQIAEEMNYRPSGIARSLVMKQSKTIGLIISEMTRSRTGHHFLFDVISGVNDRAMALGYDLILATTSPDEQHMVPYMELCHRRQLDGVILSGVRTKDPYLQEVLDSAIPCVLIDVPLLGKTCSHITLDNRKGAQQAVEYLIRSGHRRIGFINGHREAFVSEERLLGYQHAMEEAGLKGEWVFYGDFDDASGREGVCHLLEKDPDLTAFFCASDLMAVGAMRELEGMGKKVPQDVSVIGFDDIDLAHYVTPMLSTVHQPRYRFGTQAVDVIVGMLEGEQGKSVVLEPELLIREST
ncbi:LacI family DNA-binding transcriptional regulator [Desmospora profundinema]|uniref:DNA-binding LacI/PurR family transcriptional regulator n=1 Tax=Desmospora profundinema TaxID=1571184 RepID=A0ABU1ISH7_9BACL|nr:LacI family DNA-binding transcriptional regulator [Desmospora profundinema]MDR6227154.1 DNA-binding LacI/PurR family transcriptional regulator [Desmospora profundinema]